MTNKLGKRMKALIWFVVSRFERLLRESPDSNSKEDKSEQFENEQPTVFGRVRRYSQHDGWKPVRPRSPMDADTGVY